MAFFAGQLDRDGASKVEHHADDCLACRRLLEEAGKLFGQASSRGERTAVGASASADVLRFGTASALLESLRTVDDDEYVVGRELARGGMGRILEAVDRHGRRVAIKVLLRPGDLASRRFVREMQITARLQHPSIVTLYEAGRWRSNEPFFSMKLVEGRSLTDEVAAAHKLETRLALLPRLLAVTDALAYAHDRGIIHRDLKPANVLVGDFGETVVIDWGLARVAGAPREGEPGPGEDAAASAALTHTGTAVGTPAYMPPEQARGEPLDERADVYSLGAVLYHLLAGGPPYQAATTAELLERVQQGPPPPLSARVAGVPPDLEAIVAKSMARAPPRRYASAREMSADLRRFTTGRLVAAHTYSTAALVRRWATRHRAAVTVGATLLALLAITGGLSVSRIVRERNRAERLQVVATGQRDSAERLVDYLVGEFQKRVVAADRLDLLGGLGGEVARYYAASDRRHDPADAAALGRRAAVMYSLARVEGDRHNGPEGIALYRRAIELRERARALGPPVAKDLVEESLAWNNLAIIQAQAGDIAAGLQALERALALAEQARRLAPDDLQTHLRVTRTVERISETLQYGKGDLVGARARAREALAQMSALVTRRGPRPDLLARLGAIHGRLLWLELQLGQVDTALQSGEAALDAYQRAVRGDPRNGIHARHLAQRFGARSTAHLEMGRLDRARADMALHLDAYQKVAAADPSSRATQRDLGLGHASACDLSRRADRLSEALAACRRSIAIFSGPAGDAVTTRDRDGLVRALVLVARVEERAGRRSSAQQAYQRALGLARKLDTGQPGTVYSQQVLQEALAAPVENELALGLDDQAAAHAREALALAERLANASPDSAAIGLERARARLLMGKVQRRLGQVPVAREHLRSSLRELDARIAAAPGLVSLRVVRAEAARELGDPPSLLAAAQELRRLRAEGRLSPEDEDRFAPVLGRTRRVAASR